MDEHSELGGRLPLIDTAALGSAQQRLMEYLEASKLPWAKESGFKGRLADGRLIGPFNGFLYAPEMAQGMFAWVDAESEHTSLADDVRQVIILAVGVAWKADYEIYAHAAVARHAGLSDESIAEMIDGRAPTGLSRDAAVAYRFAHALAADRSVSDEIYEDARAVLGLRGVVDMTQLIAQYLATSALLNAFRVPAPRDS